MAYGPTPMPAPFFRPAFARRPCALLAALTLAVIAFPWGATHAQTTATVTDLFDFGSAPDGYNLAPLVQADNGNF